VPTRGIAATIGESTSTSVAPGAPAVAVAAVVVASGRAADFVITIDSSKEPQVIRRSVVGAGIIAGAMLFATAGTAAADPPNCTAADLAGVMSGVSAGTSSYLFTHPDVNAFFTGLKGKSRDEMSTDIQAYFDANPQVRDELRAVRQAAADFKDRCDIAVPDGPLG
jgi:heme-binding protein